MGTPGKPIPAVPICPMCKQIAKLVEAKAGNIKVKVCGACKFKVENG